MIIQDHRFQLRSLETQSNKWSADAKQSRRHRKTFLHEEGNKRILGTAVIMNTNKAQKEQHEDVHKSTVSVLLIGLQKDTKISFLLSGFVSCIYTAPSSQLFTIMFVPSSIWLCSGSVSHKVRWQSVNNVDQVWVEQN